MTPYCSTYSALEVKLDKLWEQPVVFMKDDDLLIATKPKARLESIGFELRSQQLTAWQQQLVKVETYGVVI